MNSCVAVPVVGHDRAVVGRWPAVLGTSVGADSLVEPAGYRANGRQGGHQVGRRPSHEVGLGHKLLPVQAFKPMIKC